MKKFIQWLAKKFNANITIKETTVKEVEKKVYVYDGDVVRKNLRVEGDLVIEGRLEVYGNVTAKGTISAHGANARMEILTK